MNYFQRTTSSATTYVWEAPVRIWHWIMMVTMFVQMVTGYLIGSPLPSVPGEASESFFFGYIRFAHFAAGYIFAVTFVLRIYWAFVGNRHAREIFVVPKSMFTREFWDGLIHQQLYYLFMRREGRSYGGHNPLEAAAMFFMFVLGSLFMIFTGFALYGEGAGMGSWQYNLFSSWIIPLIGDSQKVHTWHHLGMWYLIVFTMIHLYMVVREDIYTRETVISTMINGYRVSKDR